MQITNFDTTTSHEHLKNFLIAEFPATDKKLVFESVSDVILIIFNYLLPFLCINIYLSIYIWFIIIYNVPLI